MLQKKHVNVFKVVKGYFEVYLHTERDVTTQQTTTNIHGYPLFKVLTTPACFLTSGEPLSSN